MSAWCREASDIACFPDSFTRRSGDTSGSCRGPTSRSGLSLCPAALGLATWNLRDLQYSAVSPRPPQIQTQCLSFCLISLEIPKDTVYLLPLFSLPGGQRVESPPTAFGHLAATPHPSYPLCCLPKDSSLKLSILSLNWSVSLQSLSLFCVYTLFFHYEPEQVSHFSVLLFPQH